MITPYILFLVVTWNDVSFTAFSNRNTCLTARKQILAAYAKGDKQRRVEIAMCLPK